MTDSGTSFPDAALGEVAFLLTPLARLGSATGPEWLLRTLGWDPPAIADTVEELETLGEDIEELMESLEELVGMTDEDERLQQFGVVGGQVTAVIAKVAMIPGQIEALLENAAGFLAAAELDYDPVTDDGLLVRLVDYLVVTYLSESHERFYAVALLFGLIEYLELPAEPARRRVAGPVAKVYWKRLPELITNPGKIADDVYSWSTDVDHEKLIARLGGVAVSFGLASGRVEQPTEIHEALDRPAAETTELRVPIVRTRENGAIAEAGLLVSEAPAQGAKKKGLGIVPYGRGSVSFDIELRPGLRATVGLAGGVEGGMLLAIRPTGIEPHLDLFGAEGDAAFKVKLARAPATPAEAAVILAGSPGETRFEAAQAFVGVTGAIDPQGPEFRVQGGLVKGAIVVMPGEGDGFLKKVLPASGIKAELDLDVVWSTRTGFQFKGGIGLEVEIPVNLSIADVIKLQSVFVRVRVAGEGLQAVVAVSATIKIGPVAGAIERVGAKGILDIVDDGQGSLGPFEPSLGFQPPSGAGLSIKAGPVTGGGYLSFDPDNEQYAGILQLSIQQINITAIGLLTTRLPDPAGGPGATKKGFSLLVIIAVELPPIQLGYGFALTGIGGLLGVHRTMMVEPLRNGVRDGTVNSILFPQNPIARAPQIISQLRTIFPPVEGRFVFGPMVKIGWGPNALIELSAAVVLELMSPVRLVILGRIQIALPDKKDPVLNLRLDIVGVLDFDKGEVSIDASLIDSRLVVFVITGDMAVRVGWGASKIFVLAAGGFHPEFDVPPGFPALRRLAIALSDSDNPRLRMEVYKALTANTIQFGAGVDAYVRMDVFVGSFSVAAKMAFDALIQFQPFELKAALSASVDIELNDEPLLHAAFNATLTGPTPWHAIGYAEFDFLGKRRVDFELTTGEAAKPPIPEIDPGEVLEQVAAAFASPDAWGALPANEADRVVSLRDSEPGDAVRVHPLGALSARQRLVPLGQTIDRFGTSVVAANSVVRPTEFRLVGFKVGVSAATVPQDADLYDDFSPGQFLWLTDDERVARPAFESMRSGGSVKATRFRVPADRPAGMPGSTGYEEAIVDVEPVTGLRSAGAARGRKPAEEPAGVLDALVHGGPAAFARTRSNGAREFRGPELAVGVAPERYVVADADTLVAVAGAPAESSAEAYDRLGERPAAAAPAGVVPVGEAG